MMVMLEAARQENIDTTTPSPADDALAAFSQVSFSPSARSNYADATSPHREIQYTESKVATPKSSRSSRPSHDVGDYVRKIRDIPRITREQELEIAYTYCRCRAAFTTVLLQSRPVIERALGIIDDVTVGNLRLDAVMDLDERSRDGIHQRLKLLACNAPTMRAIFDRNDRLLAQPARGELPQVEQQRSETTDNLIKMGTLLAECRLSYSLLVRLYRVLQQFHGESPRIESSERGGYRKTRDRIEAILSAADAIRSDTAALGESHDDFRRRMELLRNHFHGLLEAKAEMAQGNLRLVVAVARKYKFAQVPFADLIQEGNAGLMRAIEKYEPTLGTRFSTYATWWIKQAIRRSLEHSDTLVRLPARQRSEIAMVLRQEQALTHSLGAPPSVEQLASSLQVSVEAVTKAKRASRRSLGLTDVLTATERSLSDFLEDKGSLGHGANTAEIEMKDLGEALGKALQSLAPRLRELMIMRSEGMTLQEVGKVLGVTRERVRQLQQQAIEQLREPHVARGLVQFL